MQKVLALILSLALAACGVSDAQTISGGVGVHNHSGASQGGSTIAAASIFGTVVSGTTVNGTTVNATSVTGGAFTGASQYVVKWKSATETVTNSTVQQNDDHLFFTVAAGETWIVELSLGLSSAVLNPAGMAFNWSMPAGTTGNSVGCTMVDNNNTAQMQLLAFTSGCSFTSTVGATTEARTYRAQFTTANAGTAQLTWAQATANATGVSLLIGSNLKAWRVSP